MAVVVLSLQKCKWNIVKWRYLKKFKFFKEKGYFALYQRMGAAKVTYWPKGTVPYVIDAKLREFNKSIEL